MSVCPVEAIWYENDLPPQSTGFVAVNSEFFDDAVTGWDQPGGVSRKIRTEGEHTVVVEWGTDGG